MLDRLRSRLDGHLLSIGEAFAKTGLSPTVWTVVGLLLSVASGYTYWSFREQGELLGGLLILASGLFDVVDGAAARASGRVSKKGAFLDSTLDRVAEVAVFTGIMASGLVDPVVVVLSVSLSLLVSYTRAKGDALGTALSGVGVGERSERLIVLAIASLLGLVQYGVWLVLILAAYTFAERTYRATRAL